MNETFRVWYVRSMWAFSTLMAVIGLIAIFKPELGSSFGYMGISLGCSAHARIEGNERRNK